MPIGAAVMHLVDAWCTEVVSIVFLFPESTLEYFFQMMIGVFEPCNTRRLNSVMSESHSFLAALRIGWLDNWEFCSREMHCLIGCNKPTQSRRGRAVRFSASG
jgi:hypothetical protein